MSEQVPERYKKILFENLKDSLADSIAANPEMIYDGTKSKRENNIPFVPSLRQIYPIAVPNPTPLKNTVKKEMGCPIPENPLRNKIKEKTQPEKSVDKKTDKKSFSVRILKKVSETFLKTSLSAPLDIKPP
jgi:hypothetical protein